MNIFPIIVKVKPEFENETSRETFQLHWSNQFMEMIGINLTQDMILPEYHIQSITSKDIIFLVYKCIISKSNLEIELVIPKD